MGFESWTFLEISERKRLSKMNEKFRKCLESWKDTVVKQKSIYNVCKKNYAFRKFTILVFIKYSRKKIQTKKLEKKVQKTIRIMKKDVCKIFIKTGVKNIYFRRKFRNLTWLRNELAWVSIPKHPKPESEATDEVQAPYERPP